ncbi:hypothetical protein BSKO_13786 [Bryopsis sp. KO-2023]|nr:hypothetical protein BSKO_13786 [Bryopsis sp. KO-2023]
MTSGLLAYAVLAVLACNALAVPDTGRDLLAKMASLTSTTAATSNTPKGRASAKSQLSVEDGDGFAASQAIAETKEKATSEIKSIVIEVVENFPQQDGRSKEEYCDFVSAYIEEDAQSIGVAAAEVTVDTFGIVEIDGVGSGCTASQAEASAEALATVELVVTAWAEARKGQDVAKAQARLKGATDVLAQAAAAATANACSSSDGSAPSFAEAFQTVVAKAYAKAVASILVFLEASVDCAGETDVFAEAEVGAEIAGESTTVDQESGSTVEGQGSADTTAEASATTTQVVPCKKEPLRSVRLCCRGKNAANDICYCNLSGKGPRGNRSPTCVGRKTVVQGVTIWQYQKDGQGEERSCKC